MRRLLAVVLGLGALVLAPPTGRAYSGAETFGAAAVEGGGGGRYFTGSLRDGYTCNVCHRGGEQPELQIGGLPEAGYIPGQTYDIVLRLPDEAAVTSAAVELTDGEGQRVGSVGLPAAPRGDEVCGEPAELASRVVDLPGGRSVVAMDACGARRVRVSWTAPPEPRGPVWFHAAAVAGNASNDPTGDGVRAYARVIPVQGGTATSAEVRSGCSASGTGQGGALAFLLLAAGLVRRRVRGVERRCTRRGAARALPPDPSRRDAGTTPAGASRPAATC